MQPGYTSWDKYIRWWHRQYRGRSECRGAWSGRCDKDYCNGSAVSGFLHPQHGHDGYRYLSGSKRGYIWYTCRSKKPGLTQIGHKIL